MTDTPIDKAAEEERENQRNKEFMDKLHAWVRETREATKAKMKGEGTNNDTT